MGSHYLSGASLAALLLAGAANAQTSGSATQAGAAPDASAAAATQQEAGADITVTGWRLRRLDEPAPTASRLGLPVREVPATIDSISFAGMLTRGFRTVEEATDSLPGITSGGSPGDPALFSMRGFTGEQVTILHNGLYLGPANMINRPGNTWNVAGVDVLQGPASVLYGQGAVGGAVNIVNKHPGFARDEVDALVSYGSFDTLSTGGSVNRRLGDDWAARIDASYHRTGGYVRHTPSDSLDLTAAITYRPNDRFSAELSVDHLADDLSPYYGTPLVPSTFGTDPIRGVLSTPDGQVVDARTRFVSYNVAGNRTYSDQWWPRLVLDWSPSDKVTISNTAYYFHADRQWINAETYSFDPATRTIDRDRFFVFQKQDLKGDQASVTLKAPVFGLANKLVGGIDYSHLNFIRSRGFPDGDSVDPFNPAPGTFGPIVPRVSPTRWDQVALFDEDVLTLVPGLSLVGGLRAERLYLTRENYNVDGSFNAATSFRRTYKLFNWRLGATWDVARGVTAYASYATGKDPVNSNIFLVNASENFPLSSARQVEAGLKADLMGGRGSITFAAYDIRRNNILTLTALDTLTNVGEQKSRGLEFSGEFRVTSSWAVTGNWTYTDAKYEDFVDPNYSVDASGHRPADVPDWTGNVWTTFRHVAGLPLELGGGIKYVGNRYGNTANTLRLTDYATGIVYATYSLRRGLDATIRVNNVWDKAFVQWADIYYPTQVQLGEPRRVEVSLLARF